MHTRGVPRYLLDRWHYPDKSWACMMEMNSNIPLGIVYIQPVLFLSGSDHYCMNYMYYWCYWVWQIQQHTQCIVLHRVLKFRGLQSSCYTHDSR